ncbi:hypothetical protein PVL29_012559 [Vitis rotundifolia]|nr:hypothetical protein PVL29_012559 [Vitis rotundifolia]
MRLRVDLECDRCYKKIKKLLSKFPEIRDQAFFEKENTVIIKVVCYSPHNIRDKLICKGGKTIKSIEIIVPEKPKPPPEKPKPSAPKAEKPHAPASVPGYPQFYPVAVCCKSCFDLGHGGPCHHGYGIPYQRPSSYDEPYGGWPSGCRCNRSYEYFTEENPACTIM